MSKAALKRLRHPGPALRLLSGAATGLMLSMMLAIGLCWHFYTEYERAGRNRVLIEELHQVLKSAQMLSAERGPANVAMASGSDQQPAAQEVLAAARNATDEALAALPPSFDAAAIEEALAQARQRVDAVIATPPAQRSFAALQQAIDAMIGVSTHLKMRIQQSGSRIIDRAPELDGRVGFAISLSTLRDHAGQLGSAVIAPLTMQVPLPDSTLDEINRLIGYLQANWYLLGLETSAGIAFGGELEALREQARERYMVRGLALVDEVIRDSRAGRPTLDATTFSDRYVAAMQPLGEWRERFIDQLRQRYRHLERQALVRFLLLTLLAGAAIALTALTLVRVYRRLQLPLLRASEDVIRLADGRQRRRGRVSHDATLDPLFAAIDLLEARLDERTRIMRDLKRQADTDGLTGLLNRSAFERAGEQLMSARGEGVIYLIMLDIDHFKAINDTHGHPVGDDVLVKLAHILQTGVRANDPVARLGGEEFALLLQAESRAAVMEAVRRLQSAIRSAAVRTRNGEWVHFSVSFGVVCADTHQQWQTLMARADEMLYAAKEAGRDRIVIRQEHGVTE
ncbi:GGDEF domain-containing protein [Kushneria aurantia]|uniref:diguanylate cyclase n=1 Tax=Kushneria aurantia TaxID=504092 RepID=A0ABV6G0H3_9GAMM|nr:GGDEF domain-containing protein [Kushneria aurantia]